MSVPAFSLRSTRPSKMTDKSNSFASQTPTFNARPVVDAAIDACKRGVEVVLYVGLGFNDKGESVSLGKAPEPFTSQHV